MKRKIGLLFTSLLIISTFKSGALSAEFIKKAADVLEENPELAVLYCDSALTHESILEEDRINEVKAMKIKGLALFYLNKFGESVSTLIPARELAKNNKLWSDYLSISNNLGVIYKTLGDYETASQYFAETYERSKKIDDQESIIRAYNNLAVVMHSMMKYEEALNFQNKALKLAIELNDSISLPNIYNNMGLILTDQEEYSEGEKYYKQAIKAATSQNNNIIRATALHNLALAKSEQFKYEEAVEIMLEALTFIEEEKNITEYATVNLELSKLYSKLSNTEKALEHIEKGKAYIGTKEIRRRYLEAQRDYFIATDNEEQAYAFYDSILDIQNDLFNDQTKMAAVNLQNLKEIDQERTENRLLRADNELQEHLIDDRERTIMFSVAGILLFLILSIFLFTRTQKLKKLNALLEEKEEQLNQEHRKVISANQSKTRFLGMVSHEIKNPLGAIQGVLELLREEKMNTKEGKVLLGNVISTTKTLRHLLNDILDTTKIEENRLDVNEKPFDPAELIKDVAGTFRSHVERKGLDFKVEVPINSTSYIGDTVRIKQVLFNLTGNAIKFTDSGLVKLSLSILAEDSAKDRLEFSVEDTGIGIAPKDQKRIFDYYEKANPTEGEEMGSGLGLNISKKIVELLGGRLQVKSILHKGSVFSFSLILEKYNQERQMTEVEHLREKTMQYDKKHKVMLVEDDALHQIIFEKNLSKLGLDVIIAENGEEGLLKYKSYKPELVFMDMKMGDVSGEECALRIRQYEEEEGQKPSAIVAYTASLLNASNLKYEDAGINDVLPKPFTRTELLKVLKKFLLNQEIYS